MNWGNLIASILQALPSLVVGMDTLFEKGTDKKQAVMSVVQAAIPVAAAADPKNAQAITALASAGVDSVVQTMNAVGALQHGAPVSFHVLRPPEPLLPSSK